MYFPRHFRTILQGSRRNRTWLSIAVAILVTVWPAEGAAQTTVSTELTGAKRVDLSVEFLGSMTRRQAGGFEWYLTDLTFGVTPRLEIGAGWSVLVPGSVGEPHEIIPHAKVRLFESETSAIALGGAWHAPVSNRDESTGYGWIYLAASRTWAVAHPITISAGVYELIRRDVAIGDTRRGVSLGWDQAMTDRWSYSIEWISGTNWYGYLSPAITFSAGPHWITGGYCVGNDRGTNHGPCLSAGRTF